MAKKNINKDNRKPPVEEEQGKKSKLLLIIYNVFMAILSFVALAFNLYTYHLDQLLKPMPIDIVNEELKTGIQEISNVYNSFDYVELFSRESDANNYKIFHKNVNSMIQSWKRYGNLEVSETNTIKDNIVTLRDIINQRKRFDKDIANVLSSIKCVYETEFIRKCGIFPDKDRVQLTIKFQETWITSDSINNNYAIAYLDKIDDRLKLNKECTKEMIHESISDLQKSDKDVKNKSAILNFFKLLLEIGYSFEQYKISHLE